MEASCPVQLPAPDLLTARYAAWQWTQVSCWPASTTWRLHRDGSGDRFLKVTRRDAFPSLAAEAARTRWAGAHLPVPEILDTGGDETVEWLVNAALPGRPATDPTLGPPQRVVTALAEGLRRFHDTVPVAGCPFEFRLDTAMDQARRRVHGGLVDPAEDFDDEHRHLDADTALRTLARLRPAGEDLVVCHGDYCPPNALVTGNQVTGYVDLGELGIADRWWDIAVATRAATRNYGPGLEDLFLTVYGTPPDPQRRAFYRLLYDLVS